MNRRENFVVEKIDRQQNGDTVNVAVDRAQDALASVLIHIHDPKDRARQTLAFCDVAAQLATQEAGAGEASVRLAQLSGKALRADQRDGGRR